MLVTINITESDIASGEPNCSKCPAALALRRALPQYEPEVSDCYVGLRAVSEPPNSDMHYFAVLPEDLQKFIENFDEAKPVKPLVVSLDFKQYDPDE